MNLQLNACRRLDLPVTTFALGAYFEEDVTTAALVAEEGGSRWGMRRGRGRRSMGAV
jgi:hypothetical protein